MKRMVKKVLQRLAQPLIDEIKKISEDPRVDNEASAQKLLMGQYRLLASLGHDRLPNIRDVGFRKYSQFEEDGILLYIFSLIRLLNRKCVEICAGEGRECNTANLIINHGWWGYLFNGDEENVKAGVQFFTKNRDTFLYPRQTNIPTS